jgi:ATP-dependent helicase HepA
MLEKAEAAAALRAQTSIADAINEARETLDAELARLRALQAINLSISEAEVTGVEEERAALLNALPQARLRLDAVRFVVSPDFLALR